VEQYAKFVKEYKMYQFPTNPKILEKKFEVDDFEKLKKNEILPNYYYSIRIQDKIKNYLKINLENPDVGYWGKDEYFVFRTSVFNENTKKSIIYTFYFTNSKDTIK